MRNSACWRLASSLGLILAVVRDHSLGFFTRVHIAKSSCDWELKYKKTEIQNNVYPSFGASEARRPSV